MNKIKASLIVVVMAISVLNAQVGGLSGWNIVLDPGHSQKENMGSYGYSEAEKNLGVALHLHEILSRKTDIDTVYLTRWNDYVYVTLSQRTDYANSLHAAWYHSIHSDAGAPQYNSTLLLWGQLYDGTPDPPVGGEEMSAIMVDILTRGMRIPTRGSWGDCSFYKKCSSSWPGPYLHVNRETTMPSELSEAGFHTNPTQNQRNMNTEWKRLEAYTFFWSILRYHHIERPFVGVVTGIIKDKESGVPINGARVTIMDKTYITDTYESLFHKYTSDPDKLRNGFYFIEGLPDSTVLVKVEAENYYPDSTTVSINDTFFTFQDFNLISTVPPYIISSSPAEGDASFLIWTWMEFKFSRPMNKESVENNLFVLSGRDTLRPEKFRWYQNDTYLKASITSLEPETTYVLTISAKATDKFNHPLDGNHDGIGGDNYVINFRTGPPDLLPPEVEYTYPPLVSSDIELKPVITVVFNEPLDTSRTWEDKIKLERFSDHSFVNGTLYYYEVKRKGLFTFFPYSNLLPKELYVTRVYPGICDTFGNEITNTKSYSFMTGDYDFIVTKIDPFEENITSNWWTPSQSGSTTGIEAERSVETVMVNHLTGSTKALKIEYEWDESAGEWLLREYLAGGTPKNVRFDKSYIMQVYIFGDGSGNKFRFCVDDRIPNYAVENHEVSPWIAIDWIGWKLISWDMSADGTGTWIGDGNLDGTLGFDSIQLTHEPGADAKGVLYFDDLKVVKKQPLSMEEELAVYPRKVKLMQNYPNPFNAFTTVPFYLPTQTEIALELYNLNGQRVKVLYSGPMEQGYHEILINANGLASGVYLCKLNAAGRNFTRKMIILK